MNLSRVQLVLVLSLAALCLLVAPGMAAAQASFEMLPFERPFSSPQFPAPKEPLALSADGRTVVGTYFPENSSSAPAIAARWDEGIGLTELESLPRDPAAPGPPELATDNFARGVSADGSTIVGRAGLPARVDEIVVWDSSGSITSLAGDLPVVPNAGPFDLPTISGAVDVSADGAVVLGQQDPFGGIVSVELGGFIWDEANGARGIKELSGITDPMVVIDAAAISDDGLTVAGFVSDQGGSTPYEAIRWTESGGLDRLGFLGVQPNSQALGISGDGSTIVGRSELDATFEEAFRWTEGEGMVGLGQVEYEDPGGVLGTVTSLRSVAWATSEDGSVVVGGGETAWVYSEALGGMVGVRDLLIRLGIVGLDDIDIYEAVDVSADGTVITGWARYIRGGPSLTPFAWRAVVPEPSTALLVGLGLLGLSRGGRSGRVRAAPARRGG